MNHHPRRRRLSRIFPGIAYLKLEFRRVWRSHPGERFHARYRRVRRRKGYDEMAPRMIRIVFALTSFAVGVSCILLPLPEVPFFILSGALLASESAALARMMDRVELRFHGWAKAGRAKWQRAPLLVKGVLAGIFIGVIAARCYLLVRSCLK
jgi:hypothetical protein